ncbi:MULTISPECIES: hypothetical protein [unclassified Fusibacter]|uniref:hypothetical protein n=1 Tax=unclassified Fusibacter TaxID=2624464 RepID=UPI0013E986C7|nr:MULTISPECIES: hypothetical protein [unclassified Fusibacter]MCK8059563.1 hypothetical protein [Fusibacter sp. A2]NPE21364.1 hypothetical protein [Fusibacter sp. A1]
MKKLQNAVFNLGVILCLAVGLGSLLDALPEPLKITGSILGLVMVGVGYAMKRQGGKA